METSIEYKNLKPQIKSGDVLAWTHKGIKSWKDFEVFIVRLAQRSEYSHVGIAWVVGERTFILEAVGSGLRIYPLSKELPCYHIKTDIKWTKKVEGYALSKVGEPYSKWEAIKGFLTGKTTKGDGQWQCAEFCKAVLANAGMKLGGKTTPSGLVDELLNQGKSLNKMF